MASIKSLAIFPGDSLLKSLSDALVTLSVNLFNKFSNEIDG
jgi:hypothetical protein